MMDSPTEPLLSVAAAEEDESACPSRHLCDLDGGGGGGRSSRWLVTELYLQFWLAGPMVCVGLLQYSLHLVSIMFVGHLGELELAGASMAISFAGVTGFSLLIGMGSALETLCGQAHGAREHRLLGIYLQRAVVVLNAASVPMAAVWWNVGAALRAAGQDAQIAEAAGQYARWMLPSLFAYATLQPLDRFLLTQSAVLPMALCCTFTLCVHVPVSWLVIFKLGVGFRGAALTIGASQWLNVALLSLYVKFGPACRKSWTGLSAHAFRDLGAFFKFAVPSAVMICLEMWSFEFVVLLSGFLPNPKLETAALSISLNTIALMNMIPAGLSAASSTRVANELGAGRVMAAKKAAVVSVSLGLVGGLFMASLAFAARHIWAYAFTSEAEVVGYLTMIIPFIAGLTIFDATQTVLSGVIRGCGNQALGAYTNLAAFYVVGLPLAVTLAFRNHLNGKGLWVGMIAALAVQATALSTIALRTKWEKKAEEARDRVSKERLPGPSWKGAVT